MKLHSTFIGSAVAVLSTVACAFLATPAYADDAGAPGECAGGACGTPNNNGGGCGCGCGGSILVDYTDIGQTYEQSDDSDHDGIDDSLDNCPFTPNPDQADGDGDGVGDVCDNCAAIANHDQKVNTCGDVWSKSTSGFTSSLAENNIGQVIGEVCDTACTFSRANQQPVTVALTPGEPGEVGTTGSSSSIPASGEAACSVTSVGTSSAPAGLFVVGLGVLGLSVIRRRRSN